MPSSRARRCASLALLALLPASAGAAQEAAVHPRAFQSVAAVRELGDGRAIVLDVDAREVALVDFGAGTTASIGRSSATEAEYLFPVGLLRLAGDTTLIVDPARERLLPVLPDGRTAEAIAIPAPLRVGQWRGADARGRLYMQLRPGGVPSAPQGPQPDSLLIVRWDRASGRIDTVARVKAPATMVVSDGMMQMVRPRPLAAVDDWAVAADGSIGIARAGDYHVEWHRGADVVRGAPVSFTPVPVTPADVEAVNRAEANPRGRFVTGPGGGPATRELPPPPISAAADFPKVKPPFVGAGAHISADGTLWVRRSVPAGAEQAYDLFDASGAHLRQVSLPAGSRVVGVGSRGFYVERAAEGGARLERHAIP